MLLNPGVLTSGLIKSNRPRFPITPPGLADASLNSCAAFAILRISPAIFSRLILRGPIPSKKPFVFPPKSAFCTSQSSNISAIPNIPSALSLNKFSIFASGNISATPFNPSSSSVLIPLMMSLNNAPIN